MTFLFRLGREIAVKVLIYGAGVIGTLYAGKLADAGHKATVVARGQRLGDIRQQVWCLRISSMIVD
jgi:ketopantoate reductase